MSSAAWGVAHSYGDSFSQQVASDGSACPLEVPVPLNIVRTEMPENYSFFIFLKRQKYENDYEIHLKSQTQKSIQF